MSSVDPTASTPTPSHLLSPQQIGNVTVRNRVVMAPHSTHYADRLESAQLGEYYLRRAQGGVGLIVHEPVVVHPSSITRTGKVWGFDPGNAQAYRATTDAVHAAGARIVCQILHNGRQVDGHSSGMPAWYTDEVVRSGSFEFTREMSIDEINTVIDGFVETAAICQQGGFDGVEIHASHGYLLQGFLSPATNHRTDGFGGSTENRGRIVRLILQGIRDRVGPDFVIGLRVAGDEYQTNGFDIDESIALIRTWQPLFDYLSVVSGSLASYDRIVPDMTFPEGFNAGLARQLRAEFGPTPIIVTGRINDPVKAEAIIANGDADFVGMARALIADPDWVRKAAEVQRTRPCVYGNECRDSIVGRRALTCMVNPEVGHPDDTPQHSELPSPVVVVGAGVAGLEAACTARRRGAEVVLFEAGPEVGGQLRLAARATQRENLLRIAEHLHTEALELGVQIRLNSRATAESVAAIQPGLIVDATGARPRSSRLGESVISTWDLLQTERFDDDAYIVLDEIGAGAWSSLAAVAVLVDQGKRVSYVTPAATLAAGVESGSMPIVLSMLRQGRVAVHLLSNLTLRDGGATVTNSLSGAETHLDATVVADAGRTTAGGLTGSGSFTAPVVIVGDALAPRRIATAIRDGRASVS